MWGFWFVFGVLCELGGVELYRIHKCTNPVNGVIIEKADNVLLISANVWEINELETTTMLPTIADAFIILLTFATATC